MNALQDAPRAVVTGGGRGIGRAEALALAQSGARVVVNYSRSADAAEKPVDEITAAGGEAYAVPADMADPDGPDTLMERAAELLGGIDVLVSNAGVEHFGELGTVTAAELDATFAVNTRGQFLAVQAAARHMGINVIAPGGTSFAGGDGRWIEAVWSTGWGTIYGGHGVPPCTTPTPQTDGTRAASVAKSSSSALNRPCEPQPSSPRRGNLDTRPHVGL